MRRLLCPAQTAAQGPAGGAVGIPQCAGDFGTGGGHRITRKHIFTHIVWEMRGIYAQVREKTPEFTWMTPGEIDTQAALPTAFRLFWEETEHV